MLLGAAGRIPGDWRNITPELLAEVAGEGFGALNVIVQDPVSMTSQDIARLKGMFEEAGVLVGQTNGAYGGGLVSPDQGEREAAIEFARRMCGLTAQLGSPNTYLRPGSLNPNGPWLPHPGNRSDEVFDRLVDSARKFCRAAQDEGVMVAVEGGAVSPLYSARRVRDFIEAVGSPALGFNQDPVNFIGSLEDAYDTTRILDEFFELTGEFTLGAHAKDFTVMDQLMVRFEEAEIGSGMLDHVTFLQGMQRVCSAGHVLIEHLPPERYAAAAVEYRRYASIAGIEWDNQTGDNHGGSQ